MAGTVSPRHSLHSYDEHSYPRSADSDMESEEVYSERSRDSVEPNNDGFTSVNMEGEGTGEGRKVEGVDDPEKDGKVEIPDNPNKDSILDDFTCAICAQMLIDPMTLHCGHSFCQLCLASMWQQHPSKLLCPVCRQPWRNLPGINIQLRYGRQLLIAIPNCSLWTCTITVSI